MSSTQSVRDGLVSPASEIPPAAAAIQSVESADLAERLVSFVRIIAALSIIAALWAGQVVWIPLVLSVLISYALEPVVAFFAAHHLPRAIGVPIVMVLVLGTGGAGAYMLRGEAVAFVDRLPSASHSLAEAIRGMRRGAPGTVSKVQDAARELESAASVATTPNRRDGVTPVRIEEPAFRWSNWLWQGSHGAIELSGQMFAVLCLVYCLLLAGDLYKRKLVRMVPTFSNKKITVEVLAEIDRQIERFLLARVAISVIVGLAVWLVFRVLDMEEAGVWGVISAALFAIPIVGPVVVVIAAAVAAFVQFGTVSMGLGVGALCVAIAAVEGNVLTPWLMSRVGEMNTVAVFVSLLFWGWLWGVWGLLLAVPITAALKAVCERVPDLSAVAELLKE